MSLVTTLRYLNNISVVLKAITDESDVTILTYDKATKLVSSAYFNDDYPDEQLIGKPHGFGRRALRIIQKRVDDVIEHIDPAEVLTLDALLGGSLIISDLTGTISPKMVVDANFVKYVLTGYAVGVPTHTVISLPHSTSPYSAPSLL